MWNEGSGGERTQTADGEDQIPERSCLDGLEDMEEHGQSEKDAIDDSGSERGHISVGSSLQWVVSLAASRPDSHGSLDLFFCSDPTDPEGKSDWR